MGIAITVGSGMITVISLIVAYNQNRKAKYAEKEIESIRKAVESHKYLKEKAFEYYAIGRIEDSLDVFRKYLIGNKNEQDYLDIIREIFKKESEIIFGEFINFEINISLTNLLITWMMHEQRLEKKPKYSNLLIEVLNLYKETFEKTAHKTQLVVDIVNGNYENVKDSIQYFSPFEDDKMNESFYEVIFRFLNIKEGNGDDPFEDDIPF